jgi:hypothetical protein
MKRRAILALTILAILALLLILLSMGRGVLMLLNASTFNAGGGSDPMFAEPVELFTRPPETDEQETAVVSGDEDPSRNWHYETLTPVEKTPSQLAEEALQR